MKQIYVLQIPHNFIPHDIALRLQELVRSTCNHVWCADPDLVTTLFCSIPKIYYLELHLLSLRSLRLDSLLSQYADLPEGALIVTAQYGVDYSSHQDDQCRLSRVTISDAGYTITDECSIASDVAIVVTTMQLTI